MLLLEKKNDTTRLYSFSMLICMFSVSICEFCPVSKQNPKTIANCIKLICHFLANIAVWSCLTRKDKINAFDTKCWEVKWGYQYDRKGSRRWRINISSVKIKDIVDLDEWRRRYLGHLASKLGAFCSFWSSQRKKWETMRGTGNATVNFFCTPSVFSFLLTHAK